VGGKSQLLALKILVEFLQLEYLVVAFFDETVPLGHLLTGEVPFLLNLFELLLGASLRVLKDFVLLGQKIDGLLVAFLLYSVLTAKLSILTLAVFDVLQLNLEFVHKKLEDVVLAFEIVDSVDVGLIDLELC